MTLEALSSNEFLNFIIYDTIFATPYTCNDSNFLFESGQQKPQELSGAALEDGCSSITRRSRSAVPPPEAGKRPHNLSVQGRKKSRRRTRTCKNKEETETQRMTHITVERNRRKQMNEHLAVLRSLMPESYVKRGDQASIVGAAIEYVKELEHLLQTLEAQKLVLLQGGKTSIDTTSTTTDTAAATTTATEVVPHSFAQFFAHPQYTWSQNPNKYTSKSKAAVADIEVTLIETHANLRILSRRSPRQLSKMVAGFQTFHLTILHLNVTTLDPFVLYSISAKVEEGCQLTCADDIAGAVHQMLRIIEEEAATLC
ncbi:transcription factor bHLH71 [Cornus florida]|uniref:transcription factor bHLH71 n=1 Tax=Cornus florida TaxID=4283 RepID=UPI0028A2D41A|nr:transcription factor bHLH71 [Cornus florida]